MVECETTGCDCEGDEPLHAERTAWDRVGDAEAALIAAFPQLADSPEWKAYNAARDAYSDAVQYLGHMNGV